MEIFSHVVTDEFNFAIMSLFKIVNDKVRIESTEIVEEHGNKKVDRAFPVALSMSGAKKVTSDLVVVADFRALQFICCELVSAEVTARRVFKLRLLARVKRFHLNVSYTHRNYFLFLFDLHIQKV